MSIVRGQLAGSREIEVKGVAVLASRFELIARRQHAGWLEWAGGFRPELRFARDDTEALLRCARLVPLVVEGHVHDPGRSSTVLYLGSATDGLVEVGPNQFLRKRWGVRDLIATLGGDELLVGRVGRGGVVSYRADRSDFKRPELLELMLLHVFTLLYRSRYPLRSAAAFWGVRLPAGQPLTEHWACRRLGLSEWRGGDSR